MWYCYLFSWLSWDWLPGTNGALPLLHPLCLHLYFMQTQSGVCDIGPPFFWTLLCNFPTLDFHLVHLICRGSKPRMDVAPSVPAKRKFVWTNLFGWTIVALDYTILCAHLGDAMQASLYFGMELESSVCLLFGHFCHGLAVMLIYMDFQFHVQFHKFGLSHPGSDYSGCCDDMQCLKWKIFRIGL